MDTKPISQTLDELIASLEKELEVLEGEEKKLLEEFIRALKERSSKETAI